MNSKWINILAKLEYSFQAIIDTHTGKLYAVEALLRNVYEAAGTHNIQNLFDNAFEDNVLYEFDLQLRHKAIEKFSNIKIPNLKLFYNLDNRIIYNTNYETGNTLNILKKFNLSKDAIYFELSEKGTMLEQSAMSSMIKHYKTSGFNIVIDDFGIGVSGLKLLYFSEANIIKIDRYFITNIHKDSKKKLFCSSITNMAHMMGMKVVAEGVEKKEEYYTCKEIGLDFIQGYLVQKAQVDITQLCSAYEHIIQLIEKDKRSHKVNSIKEEYIQDIKALDINASLEELFTYFKKNPENTFVPLIDSYKHIKGIIYELDIKQISYSQYGHALAKNKSNSPKLSSFMKEVLSVEEKWGADKILEIYNNSQNNSKGIFVTSANKYKGFISLSSLLSLSYKRNIEIAKNQNPLTKLPGNEKIAEFLHNCFEKNEIITHILYFDFNDFKPFNDYYGFRQGDRAILIFSELLKKTLPFETFIAHIGGDDFFVAFEGRKCEEINNIAKNIQNLFKDNVKSLYKQEDIKNNYINTNDRFNIKRKFSLLSVSCAIIEINKKRKKENFDFTISLAKKASKKTSLPLCLSF